MPAAPACCTAPRAATKLPRTSSSSTHLPFHSPGDSEYHDALEELPEALSSRGSVDGAHTPRAGAHGHGDDAHGGAHGMQQQGSLVDRIALWWDGRKSTSHGASAGMEGEVVHTPRGHGHGHGSHATPRLQDSLRLSVRGWGAAAAAERSAGCSRACDGC